MISNDLNKFLGHYEHNGFLFPLNYPFVETFSSFPSFVDFLTPVAKRTKNERASKRLYIDSSTRGRKAICARRTVPKNAEDRLGPYTGDSGDLVGSSVDS